MIDDNSTETTQQPPNAETHVDNSTNDNGTIDFLYDISVDLSFAIGSKTDDPVAMYLEDIFTVQANICGTPAVSLPLGNHSNGMPFGIQLMAPSFEEKRLLEFSHYLMNNN